MENYSKRLELTIEKLSDPESYNFVCYEHHLGIPLPSIKKLHRIIELVREIVFPGYYGNTSLREEIIKHYMGVYIDELYELLGKEILAGLCFDCSNKRPPLIEEKKEIAKNTTLDFIEYIPEIRRKLIGDIKATYLGDPAAINIGEVIFCYPAVKAIANYRIAHRLAELDVPLIPRFITEMAHGETGIDIHPKAQIGEHFSIDHGTGVVIGSTSIIGNNVKLYQGVTLGAKSFQLDKEGNPVKGIPRHPIVENNVVIYAGATILGRVTIGRNSIIGGNVWVTKNVPPNSKILQSKSNDNFFSEGTGI